MFNKKTKTVSWRASEVLLRIRAECLELVNSKVKHPIKVSELSRFAWYCVGTDKKIQKVFVTGLVRLINKVNDTGLPF